MFGIFNRKNSNIDRKGELRIVKEINSLGEITFTIEKFYVWGNHGSLWGKYGSLWCWEVRNISTKEEALRIKSELETQELRKKIVSREVIK